MPTEIPTAAATIHTNVHRRELAATSRATVTFTGRADGDGASGGARIE
jgi:hypothetical protein